MTVKSQDSARRTPGNRKRGSRIALETLETRQLMSGFAAPKVVTPTPLNLAGATTTAEFARPASLPKALPQASPAAAASPSYVLDGVTHHIHQLNPDGSNNNIGQQATQYIVTSTGMYGLNSHKHAVDFWNGSSWRRIGTQASQIVAAGDKLYGLDGIAHTTKAWDGSGWTEIGKMTAQLASAGGRLYGLNGANATVFRYNGVPGDWTPLQRNASQIVSAGDRLYALDSGDNKVYRYESPTNSWTPVAAMVSQIVSTGTGQLYALNGGNSKVYRFEAGTESWTPIRDDVKQIATDAGVLIALNRLDNTVYKYQANELDIIPGWLPIKTGATQIGTDAGQLVILNGSDRSIQRYDGLDFRQENGRDIPVPLWTRVRDFADEIAGDSGFVVARDGTHAYRHDVEANWTHLGGEISRVYTSAGLVNAVNNRSYVRHRFDATGWTPLDSTPYADGSYVREPKGEIAMLTGGKRYPLTFAYYQRNKIWERGVKDINAVQYAAIPYGDTLA